MRSAALILALLIALSGAAPAAALVETGVDGGQEPVGATGSLTHSGVAQVEADETGPATEIRVHLEADTDARWTISYRYALTDVDEITAFRDLGAEYESGRADIGLDATLFQSVAGQVSTATGREMQIRDVDRTATVDRAENTTADEDGRVNATGVLTLSFTWTNFLEEQADGTLVLGDAFSTGNGDTWLSSLGADQRLTIVTPPGFVISRTSFPVQTQNGSLVIDGPQEFAEDEQLSVTYQQSATAELPQTLLIGGAVVAVVVLALVYYISSGRGQSRETDGPGSDQPVANGHGSASGGMTAGAGTTETAETVEHDSGDSAAVDDIDDTEDEDDTPDFELLSDEERVEYLLEERGGRMKQANIVKETGWSDAKVSQLLSSMAENGRVEKLRLGRENLISIPKEDEGRDEST